MSSSTSETASGHWLTAREVARASQLRQDLVERFLPAADPPEPLYSADLVSIAHFVKQLADLGTPTPAIEVAVAELRARPDASFKVALNNGKHRAPATDRRRRVLRTTGAAAAAAAVVIGGIVGTTVNWGGEEIAPQTRKSDAPPAAIAPAVLDVPRIPTTRDPVCATWEKASASYGAKLHAWIKTDRRIPAKRWSPKQRDVTMAVIPVMREEAGGLRKMADAAHDPLLAEVLRGQARYEEAFAAELPKFEPNDQALWNASSSLSASVKAICSAAK